MHVMNNKAVVCTQQGGVLVLPTIQCRESNVLVWFLDL